MLMSMTELYSFRTLDKPKGLFFYYVFEHTFICARAHTNICSVLLINVKILDFVLKMVYNVYIKRKEKKTMLWIIFILWVIFAITCVILVEVYEHEFFGFLFILSLPLMFYVPFMLMLF